MSSRFARLPDKKRVRGSDANSESWHFPVGGARRLSATRPRPPAAKGLGFTGLGRVHDDGQRADPTRFAVPLVDEDVEAARAAAGHRLAHLEFHVLVQAVAVTDDARGVAERISRSHLPSLRPEPIVDTPYMMVGSRNALVDKLLEHGERWGFSHYTVRREALGQFEPVIAELAGR